MKNKTGHFVRMFLFFPFPGTYSLPQSSASVEASEALLIALLLLTSLLLLINI